MPLPNDVPIRAVGRSGDERECRLTAMLVGRVCRITATIDAGDAIVGEAGDFFEALRIVRRVLDEEGLRLCCAGARRDAWSSGIQRDMGMGRTCYILRLPRAGERPPEVGIFDAASLDVVGTVAAQDQFQKVWLASAPEI